VRRLVRRNRLRSRVERNQVSNPIPILNLSSYGFIVTIVEEMVKKGEFCFKRKREERMAKEWANKDRYNPSHCVPEPRMPLSMGGCEFPQPRWLSREGGQTSQEGRSNRPCLEGAVRPTWLGGQTAPEFCLVRF
jgi:hypothetical protein